jgi:predicted aldo/keto reductase-like oxidoreductase
MNKSHSQNDLSRREFLTKGSVGLGCLGLLGMSGNSAAQEATTHATEKKKAVLYRTLGRTGINIPIVSMGVMNANLKDLVMESFKLGIRHFDTAWIYQQGRNETMVGDAIRQLGVRNQVVIGTKILLPDPKQTELTPQKTKEIFIERFTESLSRLQMDYVDVLYFHSMYDPQHLNAPPILEAFTELKKQKKIRFAGFSCHTNMTALLNEAAKSDFYDVALISYNYAMADDEAYLKAMQNAASKGIGLVAMKTQCQQGWYKYNLPPEEKRFYEGKIMHSALLKWVLRHEFITTAIPGYTTYEQMKTDFPVAYDLAYSQEEKKFLEDRSIKTSLKSCCRQCYVCVSTCPKNVDIPALMRTHMYAAHYSNFYQARDTINAIPKAKGLKTCVDCAACTAQCANRVDIHGKIDELKLMYI